VHDETEEPIPWCVADPLADWAVLVGSRTFIQPGVTQPYRKPLALPADTLLVHIWGSFDYKIDQGRFTNFLIGKLAAPPKGLDWRTGVRFHTVRRTFSVDANLSATKSAGLEVLPDARA
jgi:hypothetical protein